MKTFQKSFPAVILGVGLAYLAFMYWITNPFKSSGPQDSFDLAAYAVLPAQHSGRFEPIDTVARVNLMIISGKQTFVDEKGNRQPAIRWLLDVMACKGSKELTRAVMSYKVFRIDNDQVLSLLGLEPRTSTHFRYAYDEFAERIDAFLPQAERAMAMEGKHRDLYETKIVEVSGQLKRFWDLLKNSEPRLAMPPAGDKETWYSLGAFRGDMELMKSVPMAAVHYVLLGAYQKNDPKEFNDILAQAPKYFKDLPRDATTSGLEVFYNRLAPFHYAAEFYFYALVLGFISLLLILFSGGAWSRPLNRGAILFMLVGLALSTFGLVARMYIQNRPLVNVTNLYTSAVFIGWGCGVFCLFIELIYPMSIALIAGSAVGAITGIIAHNLALSGDTMEMMQAVLDTNFWLATHVTCITLGYTVTFLAGFLGILYVVLGVFTPAFSVLNGVIGKALPKMIYGVVCFATLLSFTGTVLGGIWADQSWGRFWGWDPKENGALLIVIWNALILHARWGGIVKQRGMAQLAIAGNIVVSWSWFGTNMLGVGLHSYGFMPAALAWLLVFAVSQLAIIGLGWIPQRHWVSFQRTPPSPPPPENGAVLLPKTAVTASLNA